VRMGRPNQTQDRLDALLDGRPGEVTDDLAPLLAAAEALRAELADLELDPEVVDRHLEQALDRPATVVTLPVHRRHGGSVLRRRLAAAALAAALLLVPATAASAASSSALPGQALYPLKLAVEQFRLATVQWSPTREAQERARVAARRLAELDKLVELKMFRQVPPAIRALDKAVAAANVAIVEAAKEEGADADPELVAVVKRLTEVAVAQHGELVALKTMGTQLPPAITLAVNRSPAALQPNLPTVPPELQPAVTTLTTGPAEPPVTTGTPVTQPEPQPQPQPTQTTTQPESATTAPPTTNPPTTTSPPTTDPPTTTAVPDDTPGSEGSPAGAGGEGPPPSSIIPG
jgi:Domain of unknown function (DUF5667)